MLLSKGLPVLQVRVSHLLLTACIAGLLFQSTRWYRQNKTGLPWEWEDANYVDDFTPEEEYLERLTDLYGLSNFTKWQAWRVTLSEQSLDMEPITDMHASFQPHADMSKVVDVNNPSVSDLRASKRMELPPHSSPTQSKTHGSAFLFGVSTTYERIADKDWAVLRAWKRWLTDGNGSSNGAGLVLMLDNASPKQLDALDKMLQEAGIDAYVTSTAEPTSKARRYYELVRVFKTYGATLAASSHAKHWFGLVEDTIFFPSLAYLRDRLSSYKVDDQLYIGIPSERSDWRLEGDALTTDGGGAVMLTQRIVSLVPKLPCLEADNPAPSFQAQRWDVVLRECVEREAELTMHVVPAFYSPRDDDAGDSRRRQLESYETGMRPLVLHDYQERHGLDVGMAHLVTDICGEACFMHQYLFRDDWALINGVSISHHPDGLAHHPRHHRHHSNSVNNINSNSNSNSNSNNNNNNNNNNHNNHNNHNHNHHSLGEKEEMDAREERQAGFGLAPAKTSPLVSDQILINEAKIDRRPLDWTGRREVWKLVDSARVPSGSVWQAYLKRGVRTTTAVRRPEKQDGDGGGESVSRPPAEKKEEEEEEEEEEELDSVIVLIWEKKKRP
ncbi:hypothetical protein E4U41_004675 [Claviceps citrina]|nr:hypothetical protein E4U41_004675 [Claviceps citrina]